MLKFPILSLPLFCKPEITSKQEKGFKKYCRSQTTQDPPWRPLWCVSILSSEQRGVTGGFSKGGAESSHVKRQRTASHKKIYPPPPKSDGIYLRPGGSGRRNSLWLRRGEAWKFTRPAEEYIVGWMLNLGIMCLNLQYFP